MKRGLPEPGVRPEGHVPGVMRAAKRWTIPIRDWAGALNHFTIAFSGESELW